MEINKKYLAAGIIILFALSMLSYIARADNVKHITKDQVTYYDKIGILSKIKLFFAKLNRGLTFSVMNNYICSEYPDFEDYLHYSITQHTCPSYMGGCIIQEWDCQGDCSDWSTNIFRKEQRIDGGETASIGLYYEDTLFQIYYCNEECDCSGWINKGCGMNGCNNNEMYQTRTCPTHVEDGQTLPCDDEERCIWSASCEPETTTTQHTTSTTQSSATTSTTQSSATTTSIIGTTSTVFGETTTTVDGESDGNKTNVPVIIGLSIGSILVIIFAYGLAKRKRR